MRTRDFERASAPIQGLFPPGSPQALALLEAAWPKVVGPELARRTAVVGIEGTTLRIRVPEGQWRKSLHRMQGEVIARLRALAGEVAPRRLGFMEGLVPVEEPRTPSRAPADPTPPEALVKEAAIIQDEELRARFLSSAAHYLARQKR